MKEEILRVIKGRRSIRSFKKGMEVGDEEVKILLESAIWAPSAGNLQPWFFYVVRDESQKLGLAKAAFGQQFVSEAPLVIVVCAVPSKSAIYYRSRGEELYCLQDTAASIQNILLMAHAMGFGTCWVGAFDESSVRAVLNLPAKHRPVAMIPVGYPAEAPPPRRRLRVEDVTMFL